MAEFVAMKGGERNGSQNEINSFFFQWSYFVQASIQPYEFRRDKIRLTPPL